MKFTRLVHTNGIRMEITYETKDLDSHSRLNKRPICRRRIEQGLSLVAQDLVNQLNAGDYDALVGD